MNTILPTRLTQTNKQFNLIVSLSMKWSITSLFNNG